MNFLSISNCLSYFIIFLEAIVLTSMFPSRINILPAVTAEFDIFPLRAIFSFCLIDLSLFLRDHQSVES